MLDKTFIPENLINPFYGKRDDFYGWLPDETDRYRYFCTLSVGDVGYAAVEAGYNIDSYSMMDEDPKEKPYLIYLIGCDDSSLGLRFETEEEMNEVLQLLENVGDVFNYPGCLHYN